MEDKYLGLANAQAYYTELYQTLIAENTVCIRGSLKLLLLMPPFEYFCFLPIGLLS